MLVKKLATYGPAVTAVAAYAVHFLAPSFTAYISQHAHTSLGIALGLILAAYHIPSPNQQS
jgi:hypothetical protein